MPPVHPTGRRPCVPGSVPGHLARFGACLAAVLCLASPAAAQIPGLGGPPKPPPEPESEPPEGTVRPAAPDLRTGHVYVAFGISANGAAGSIVSTVGAGQDVGAGVTGSGLLGIGLGRHGSFQIFGDGTYFTAPGSCISGCSGRSYSVGLGVTYHLAQGIAFDPWGSFGVAYRYTSVLAPLQANVTSGIMTSLASGTVFQQHYQGIDIGRVAFGGDFYPVPFFGIGPFVEADVGTNLARNYQFQDLQIVGSNGRLQYLDQHGLAAYAYFQFGFRLTFDPMRRSNARSAAAPAAPEPPPAAPPAAPAAAPEPTPPPPR